MFFNFGIKVIWFLFDYVHMLCEVARHIIYYLRLHLIYVHCTIALQAKQIVTSAWNTVSSYGYAKIRTCHQFIFSLFYIMRRMLGHPQICLDILTSSTVVVVCPFFYIYKTNLYFYSLLILQPCKAIEKNEKRMCYYEYYHFSYLNYLLTYEY